MFGFSIYPAGAGSGPGPGPGDGGGVGGGGIGGGGAGPGGPGGGGESMKKRLSWLSRLRFTKPLMRLVVPAQISNPMATFFLVVFALFHPISSRQSWTSILDAAMFTTVTAVLPLERWRTQAASPQDVVSNPGAAKWS